MENNQLECDSTKHNFIPLFEDVFDDKSTEHLKRVYIGMVCSCCGKYIKREK